MYVSQLWFSVAGSRMLRPQWNRIPPLWKKNRQTTTAAQWQTRIVWNVLQINTRPADLIFIFSSFFWHIDNTNKETLTPISSTKTQTKSKCSAFLLLQYLFLGSVTSWIICLCYSRILMHFCCYTLELISLWKWSYITCLSLPLRNLKRHETETLLWQLQEDKMDQVGGDRQPCEVWFSLVVWISFCRLLQAGGRELHCIIVTHFVFLFNFLFGLSKRQAGRQMNTNSQCSVSNISAARFTNCSRRLWINKRSRLDCQL